MDEVYVTIKEDNNSKRVKVTEDNLNNIVQEMQRVVYGINLDTVTKRTKISIELIDKVVTKLCIDSEKDIVERRGSVTKVVKGEVEDTILQLVKKYKYSSIQTVTEKLTHRKISLDAYIGLLVRLIFYQDESIFEFILERASKRRIASDSEYIDIKKKAILEKTRKKENNGEVEK